MIEVLMPEAEELGCVNELQHIRQIVMNGTSAEQQVWVFRRALHSGATQEEAFKQVVDMLAHDTADNLG